MLRVHCDKISFHKELECMERRSFQKLPTDDYYRYLGANYFCLKALQKIAHPTYRSQLGDPRCCGRGGAITISCLVI